MGDSTNHPPFVSDAKGSAGVVVKGASMDPYRKPGEDPGVKPAIDPYRAPPPQKVCTDGMGDSPDSKVAGGRIPTITTSEGAKSGGVNGVSKTPFKIKGG